MFPGVLTFPYSSAPGDLATSAPESRLRTGVTAQRGQGGVLFFQNGTTSYTLFHQVLFLFNLTSRRKRLCRARQGLRVRVSSVHLRPVGGRGLTCGWETRGFRGPVPAPQVCGWACPRVQVLLFPDSRFLLRG